MGTDYSADLDPRSLDRRNRSRIPTDIARLEGVRFLSCREPDAAQQLSAALLKNLVGGDTVVARHLFMEEEEFQPHFKLNILANRLPEVDNADDAFWQRVRVIPFNIHVPSLMPIVENLAEKLVVEEGPGILAWLVRGAAAYFAEGLDEPPEVVAATAAYREQETLEDEEKLDRSAGEWFIDAWLVEEPGATVTKETAYETYRAYSRDLKGLVPVAAKAFGMTMIRRGYERTDVKNFRIADNDRQVRAWYGVRLRQGAEVIEERP
jgi:putative DNA primase/helicase